MGVQKRTLIEKKTIIRYDQYRMMEVEDEIAVEFPLTVMFNGEEFATIVCTPVDLEELVIGFLASEGVIRFLDEIESIKIDESRGFAYVETKIKRSVSQEAYTKRMIGSCCGKSRYFYFQNDVKTAKTVMSRGMFTAEQCFLLMDELQQHSLAFQQTGGVHNAAICLKDEMIAVKTDIGRHNALDKLYGYCLKHHLYLGDKAIVFSGRISSEILLKVSKIGVGILLSKSAPTDLALELAEELNITAVGFIRGTTMNVYVHPWRITESDLAEQT